MSLSSFPDAPDIPVVLDASVVINLHATERAAEILRAFDNPFFATSNACAELLNGERRGHARPGFLQSLIDQAAISEVRLTEACSAVYGELIEGSARQTLDDGEAATVAYAIDQGAYAMIDERKARAICAVRFKSLKVCCTAELLLHPLVGRTLGKEGQIEAILKALRRARMHVPNELIDLVVNIIGREEAATCNSLPTSVRVAC
ncbi:hypothetical protein [Salinarimonas rosea]|uniref:hypothetical protein n=1 Tax=Salinarimonas rosea TaxID=552063 RepID=UPI00041077BD|nr:hypothetical protein [Salinarimonas rosea]